jgi:hypothetical protein
MMQMKDGLGWTGHYGNIMQLAKLCMGLPTLISTVCRMAQLISQVEILEMKSRGSYGAGRLVKLHCYTARSIPSHTATDRSSGYLPSSFQITHRENDAAAIRAAVAVNKHTGRRRRRPRGRSAIVRERTENTKGIK